MKLLHCERSSILRHFSIWIGWCQTDDGESEWGEFYITDDFGNLVKIHPGIYTGEGSLPIRAGNNLYAGIH
jgi:hypothetical protein